MTEDSWAPLEALSQRAPAADAGFAERVLHEGHRRRTRRRAMVGGGTAAAAVVLGAVSVLGPLTGSDRAPVAGPTTGHTNQPMTQPTLAPEPVSALGDPTAVVPALEELAQGSDDLVEISDQACLPPGRNRIGITSRGCRELTKHDREVIVAALTPRTVRFVARRSVGTENEPPLLLVNRPEELGADRWQVGATRLVPFLGSASTEFTVERRDGQWTITGTLDGWMS